VKTFLMLGWQYLPFAKEHLATASAQSFVDVLVGTAVLAHTGVEVRAKMRVLRFLLVFRFRFAAVFTTVGMLMLAHQ